MSAYLLMTVNEIEAALKTFKAELPHDSSAEGWRLRNVAIKRLSEKLTETMGATITDRYDGCRVRLAGISASSTSGLIGALNNWMAAARRRMGAAQGGHP